MNKNHLLEKHLLSRCYSTEAKVLEVLTSRYSLTGEQRPHLILTPTGVVTAEKPKSLLHRPSSVSASSRSPTPNPNSSAANDSASTSIQKDSSHIPSPTSSKRNTRIELKNYIKTTLSKQQKLAKKIQQHNRKFAKSGASSKATSSQFPVDKMLAHYEIPVFEEFSGLTNLWQEYMRNLLFPVHSQASNEPSAAAAADVGAILPSASSSTPTSALTSLLPKLSSADYTGCLLTVSQARNTQLVGTRGIVVWDTQYSFVLCVPRNEDCKEWTEDLKHFTPSEQVGGLKVVPKKGCIFSFDVIIDDDNEECLSFNIIGSRFEFRNVDRSSKKFKNHTVDDLL